MDESQLTPRDADYWGAVELDARGWVESYNAPLRIALGLRPDIEFLKMIVGTDPSKLSPFVRVTSTDAIEICFPQGYFVWFDNAATFMNLNAAFRDRVNLCRAFEQQDHSRFFHSTWSRWLVLHEVGHVVCGHLAIRRIQTFDEFEAADTIGRLSPEQLALRRAIEIDADVWAAQMFFVTIGSITAKNYWDGLYHTEKAAGYGMKDLAMIFLPFFMEWDHVGPEVARTHPKIYERLIVMLVYGQSAFLANAGEHGPELWNVFMLGIKEAITYLWGLEGSMLHKERPTVDLVSHWKRLTDAGVQHRRLHSFKDDWLKGTPPGLASE